jgi:hypothetical protein
VVDVITGYLGFVTGPQASLLVGLGQGDKGAIYVGPVLSTMDASI